MCGALSFAIAAAVTAVLYWAYNRYTNKLLTGPSVTAQQRINPAPKARAAVLSKQNAKTEQAKRFLRRLGDVFTSRVGSGIRWLFCATKDALASGYRSASAAFVYRTAGQSPRGDEESWSYTDYVYVHPCSQGNSSRGSSSAGVHQRTVGERQD